MCYSDCSFTHKELNRTLQYDFSPMGSTGSVMNGPSFTSKGTKYYHLFNISLCGTKVYTHTQVCPGIMQSQIFSFLFDFCSFQGHRPAICRDNVTDLSDKDSHSGEGNYVETFICQSTIIPSDGRSFRTALASQSISLADTFLGMLMTGFSIIFILEK